jgi:hypothetical protein
LLECIQAQTAAIENSEPPKAAYRLYLNSAPGIEEVSNTQQCGMAREYFGFDFSYPIDADICDEIRRLENEGDVENLDQYASSGGAGSSNGCGILVDLTEPAARE